MVNIVAIDAKQKPVNWLRDVLIGTLEVAPLPRWAAKMATRFVRRVPDWFVVRCAAAVHVDIERVYQTGPDLPDIIRSEAGRSVVKHYMETHRVAPTVRGLRKLVQNVINMAHGGTLPANAETIQNQVAALALAHCTAQGTDFAKQAASLLNTEEHTDCLLGEYDMVLHSHDAGTVKGIDSVLTGSRHGRWVVDRLKDMKRWLHGDRELSVRWEVETLPDNGGIYQFLLKGGKKNES